jgi:anti-sigma B factor antagonist
MCSEHLFDAQSGSQPSLLVHLGCSDAGPPRMFVFGEVDAVSAGRLQEAVVDVLRDERPSCIEMDLHGVTFLDSAGIWALVQCQADARQVDCRIRLTKPQPVIYRVLQITGLLEHFGLTEPSPADKPQAEMPRAPSRRATL